MTLVFILCFRDNFINYDFDHYIFILGGGIGKNNNKNSIFHPKLSVMIIIITIQVF